MVNSVLRLLNYLFERKLNYLPAGFDARKLEKRSSLRKAGKGRIKQCCETGVGERSEVARAERRVMEKWANMRHLGEEENEPRESSACNLTVGSLLGLELTWCHRYYSLDNPNDFKVRSPYVVPGFLISPKLFIFQLSTKPDSFNAASYHALHGDLKKICQVIYEKLCSRGRFMGIIFICDWRFGLDAGYLLVIVVASQSCGLHSLLSSRQWQDIKVAALTLSLTSGSAATS